MPAGIAPALRHGAARARQILRHGIPAASPEVLTLSGAGYVGTLAAALIPVEGVAAAAAWVAGAPTLFLAGVVLLVVLAAQVALNPIMFVVFLGSALAAVPLPGVDMTALALALAAGWALSLTGSPFTASVLILSRFTGVPATKVSWTWNGLLVAVAR
jgi:hypothetical protein